MIVVTILERRCQTMNDWTVIVAFLLSSFVLFLFGAFRKGRQEQKEGRITANQIAGFCLWKAIDSWCNYILYPTVLGVWGLWQGSVIMIVITLILNIAYILTNNATELDWTLMSWFTHLRDSESIIWSSRYARLLHRRVRRFVVCLLALVRKLLRVRRWLSNVLGFVCFSMWQDSFYAMNFLYHKKVNLRSPKVFGLFLISHLICNVAWLPIAGTLAYLAKYLLRAVLG